jgi:hypothetical protein
MEWPSETTGLVLDRFFSGSEELDAFHITSAEGIIKEYEPILTVNDKLIQSLSETIT